MDIDRFEYDDFTLFVVDTQGNPVAVTPVGRRGSGNGAVSVAWADPHTPLGRRKAATDKAGQRLTLPDTHPVAKAAFALQ